MAKKSAMRCTCTPASFLKTLLGCLIMAAGVWLFVGGASVMWSRGMAWAGWMPLLWVTVGLFVWYCGKICKMKSMCGSCSGAVCK